ncbi:S8 family serine peptidase [Micromonospora sp. CPCC 206060]|uniref:S8 family serine peptidase n=1 Tax=Micromonospora sp. CPCC 206060 TaxID=3122406 RepID=UPI002FEFAA1C
MVDRFSRATLVFGLATAAVLPGAVLAVPAAAAPVAVALPGAVAAVPPGRVVLPAVAPLERNCAEPGQPVAPVPWPQRMLGPERVWPLVRGGGITVAVLDSGVDGRHPQLRGRVEPGYDAVARSGRADDDCSGTGTGVAGVIAARVVPGTGFAGTAPEVTILPVRVVTGLGLDGSVAESAVLARGIRVAVTRGADVIAVSAVSWTDSDALRGAVRFALDRNVVVVAAAGDRRDDKGPARVSYPAAYDGVIGVGAIGPTGEAWPGSQPGPHVDLVAPGAQVATLQRTRGMTPNVSGTGLACGFVAATAALVRAKRGELPPVEVERLLSGTAVPAAGGGAYGHGVVNPYGAVNDQVVQRDPQPLPGLAAAAQRDSSALARSRERALAGTGLALLTVLVVLTVAVTLPRARRRRWRAAVAPAPPTRPEPTEPGPPVELFKV